MRMKQTLKALEGMTAGDLAAKAQSGNNKPRKAPTHTKRQTKGKKSKQQAGSMAKCDISPEEMETITREYFRNVAKATMSETFLSIQQTINDISTQETGANYRSPEIDLIHEIIEMPEEKRLTFNAGRLSRLFDSVISFSHSAAIEEILHFYKMFFPDDSRAIFRLAMTAGYILDSGSVREHLREDKTK